MIPKNWPGRSPPCRRTSRRSVQKAHRRSGPCGWATITHPYHPFRGRRFEILETKIIAGEEALVLKGSYRGNFAVPREWTDRAHPQDQRQASVSILSARHLLALMQLAQRLKDGQESLTDGC